MGGGGGGGDWFRLNDTGPRRAFIRQKIEIFFSMNASVVKTGNVGPKGQEGQEGRKTQKPKSERRAFIRQKIDFFFHERKGRMLGRRLELLKWARANGCPPRAPPRQRECERTLM